KPFPSPGELEPLHQRAYAMFDAVGRPVHRLLVDLREAPANNDPGFEVAMRPVREELLRGFARVAVVVKTAAGSLQTQRHAREDKLPFRVFLDLEEARAFLGRK